MAPHGNTSGVFTIPIFSMASSDSFVRALGIDYGTVRIGLAISDDLGFLAHPLETVHAVDTRAATARIADIVANRQIEDIVLGLPLHLDGREGAAVEKVRNFAKQLRPLLPDSIRYHEVDETCTTALAYEKLRAAGKKAKRAKPIIDQAAAVEILQAWLDRNAANAADSTSAAMSEELE